MPSRRLRVIPKPAEGTGTVLRFESDEPTMIRGKWDLDLLCGKCGATLAAGVYEGMLINLVLQCNQCDSYNEV